MLGRITIKTSGALSRPLIVALCPRSSGSMIDLILINGCGGAGKETTGRELLRKLPRAALLDIKGLSSTNPWCFEDFELGISNAVSLIHNYAEKGWPQIILVGGVNSSDRLSYLLSELRVEATIHYFWLDVPKHVRDARRIERRRDEADRKEHLDAIDLVFTDPGDLVVPGGRFLRIRPEALSPSQMAEIIKQELIANN